MLGLGLRISEALALKWSDVDWNLGMLKVERGIVRQIVDDVKTDESRKEFSIDIAMLKVLRAWSKTAAFAATTDWIFARPVQKRQAAVVLSASLEGVSGRGEGSWHRQDRHPHNAPDLRAWLSAVGTAVELQQKLMRHADIRTTMNTYGDVVTNEMQRANSAVAGLALGRVTVN